MFPVRCRVVPGIGAAAVVTGAGYGSLQNTPGYVGNTPIQPSGRPMNAFQMYAGGVASRPQTTATPVVCAPPPSLPRISPPLPPVRPQVEEPPRPPPPIIVRDPRPPTPDDDTRIRLAQLEARVAEQQQQQKQAFAYPVVETAQETKKTGTATAVGIGAAGILAALLFR